MPNEQSATPKVKLRWFHPAPWHLLVVLLIVEGILLLSVRWFPKGWAVLIAVGAVGLFMLFMLLWFVVSLIFRRRFQFSIRSLLVLTVAVAIPARWLAGELQAAREQSEVLQEIFVLGGNAGDDYYEDSPYSNQQILGSAPFPAWLLNVLGDEFFNNTTIIDVAGLKVTDTDLEPINRLRQLRFLYLSHTQITDIGMNYIKELDKLQDVRLNGTQVTDTGVERLKEMKHLKILHLDATLITDVGLKHLAGLKELKELSLDNTNITDTGLEHIAVLKQLEWLALVATKVTDNGVEKLRKALPNLHIERDRPTD
jgi:Leucine-rich repeat (LRR) protein